MFVGSGIFKSGNPAERARAIVEAVAHYKDAKVIAKCSTGLGQVFFYFYLFLLFLLFLLFSFSLFLFFSYILILLYSYSLIFLFSYSLILLFFYNLIIVFFYSFISFIKAMVGICDIANDPVNFRDREGGNFDGVPKKKMLVGHTETQVYGSSWESKH